MQEIGIGLFGLGTVGSGVVKILHDNADQITKRTGSHLVVKHAVVKNVTKDRGLPKTFTVSDQAEDILTNPEIAIVVEVMGGKEAAYNVIEQALRHKKHVITANKDLMATRGQELIKLAADNGVSLYYEAAVAGGIPILRTLVHSFTADEITKVTGIINGTSNFILTKMAQDGMSYPAALQLAQELGFAEADPTNDVGGMDAAYKLIILANFAFGAQPAMHDVAVRGITEISADDMADAARFGYTIKLLGIARKVGEQNANLRLEVAPMLVKSTHSLANIHNENNAILVKGEAVGEVLLAGPGAGELPTANSVLSDLTSVARDMTLGVPSRPFNSFNQNLKIATPEQQIGRRFIVLKVADVSGAIYQITGMFAHAKISFTDLSQTPAVNDIARLTILTHPASDAQLSAVTELIKAAEGVELVSEYKILQED
ncbi:MAG: homoserine dehydrogenase [Lactobacillaceae bacterium]|jgi:homoserine dehydrogenase|nr:homoserine dehydrogenase [Lactobacillaceae bacterium]